MQNKRCQQKWINCSKCVITRTITWATKVTKSVTQRQHTKQRPNKILLRIIRAITTKTVEQKKWLQYHQLWIWPHIQEYTPSKVSQYNFMMCVCVSLVRNICLWPICAKFSHIAPAIQNRNGLKQRSKMLKKRKRAKRTELENSFIRTRIEKCSRMGRQQFCKIGRASEISPVRVLGTKKKYTKISRTQFWLGHTVSDGEWKNTWKNKQSFITEPYNQAPTETDVYWC